MTKKQTLRDISALLRESLQESSDLLHKAGIDHFDPTSIDQWYKLGRVVEIPPDRLDQMRLGDIEIEVLAWIEREQLRSRLASSPALAISADWRTVTATAEALDVTAPEISRNAGKGKPIRDNGKSGPERRIDYGSAAAWKLDRDKRRLERSGTQAKPRKQSPPPPADVKPQSRDWTCTSCEWTTEAPSIRKPSKCPKCGAGTFR